jgi:transposase
MPKILLLSIASLGFAVKRIGLEAAPLSQWLQTGLKCAGLEVVLLETRHVKAALLAMTVKTDRKDARGLAQLIRMGWSVRCMPNRWARRNCEHCWLRASSFWGDLLMWN